MLTETAIEEFGKDLHGKVTKPTDKGYDDARKVWNGLIDKPGAPLNLPLVEWETSSTDFPSSSTVILSRVPHSTFLWLSGKLHPPIFCQAQP